MLRTISRIFPGSERGQALPLFGLFFMVLIGFMAFSIDVGRYVWARTSMQAGVDAAALAAAQSMPDKVAATTKANEYWVDNSGFIQSNGYNVAFAVTYPPGNKAISIHGEADVSTWFAKFFGVSKWHVSADGDAASQVLDIAMVMDISGSMCFDTYIQAETNIGFQMSPGRTTPTGGFAFPKLAAAITTTAQTAIVLNDIGIFNSTTSATNKGNFGTSFGTTKYYLDNAPGRAGIILIGNELMQITAINAATKTLTVTRGVGNAYTGAGSTAKTTHPVNAEVWANRTGHTSTANYCEGGSYNTPTGAVRGPLHPFDEAVTDSQYFTTLFNAAYDKIGFGYYSATATNAQGLTGGSFSAVTGAMGAIAFPSGGTNTAQGLGYGQQILNGAGKRANAVRVLVLLTDGVPNISCSNPSAYTSGAACTPVNSPSPTTCPASSTAITESVNQAAAAKAAGITVYTIGLGNGAIPCVLQAIATAGGGAYYQAPTPADLNGAFVSIAEQTHIALIK
jgi:hypothetical protein